MSLDKLMIGGLLVISSCSALHKTKKTEQTISNKTEQQTTTPSKIDYTGRPTIVYKTTHDYRKNVPVTLSEDRTKIVSYPEPTDVFFNGNLAYPTELSNGYLLDNRGISVNTAFTKYSYEEYSKLNAAPDLTTLYNSIIDKSPIVEIYNCGNRHRFKNEISELNAIINSNSLSSFKRIK